MEKKILYLTRSLEIGGLERVIVLLANHLDRERFIPYVCCISKAGALAPTLNPRIQLFIMGDAGRINIGGYRKISRLVKEHSIDLIHSHELAALLYGVPVAKLYHIPIIHTKHGYKPNQENKIIRLLEKLFSRAVTQYVCVSEELKPKIKNILKIREETLSVIYNGIESPNDIKSGPKSSNSEIIIGSVGRLNEAKNYSLLVDSFNEIQKKYPHCRLEIVGGGECEENLNTLVERLSLSKKVTIHGFKLDVEKYIERFDIFVLPSIREGLPISLLEAISRRKICIVSNAGGNTEIIKDGINGFIFESKNKRGLVKKLSKVIEGLGSRESKRIQDNAWDTFQRKFSLNTMINNYQNLYEKYIIK